MHLPDKLLDILTFSPVKGYSINSDLSKYFNIASIMFLDIARLTEIFEYLNIMIVIIVSFNRPIGVLTPMVNNLFLAYPFGEHTQKRTCEFLVWSVKGYGVMVKSNHVILKY